MNVCQGLFVAKFGIEFTSCFNIQSGTHIKYCKECHMVLFYVIVVAFLMTILVNEFTNTIMDDCNLDEFHANTVGS